MTFDGFLLNKCIYKLPACYNSLQVTVYNRCTHLTQLEAMKKTSITKFPGNLLKS